MGLVSQIFNEDNLNKLHGNLGIGHTRYSTAGTSDLINCQPFNVETLHGWIAVAHNGELVNANKLRENVSTLFFEICCTESPCLLYIFQQKVYSFTSILGVQGVTKSANSMSLCTLSHSNRIFRTRKTNFEGGCLRYLD